MPRSKLNIVNFSDYPDAEIKKLVRFGLAELELTSVLGITVRVGHTRTGPRRRALGDGWMYGISGWAFDYVEDPSCRPRTGLWGYSIRLRVGKPEDFPVVFHDPYGRAGGIIGKLENWQEGLVAITAHEGKHVEGFMSGKGLKRSKRYSVSHKALEDRCNMESARRVLAYRSRVARDMVSP